MLNVVGSFKHLSEVTLYVLVRNFCLDSPENGSDEDFVLEDGELVDLSDDDAFDVGFFIPFLTLILI